MIAVSFPFGFWTDELDALLRQEGIDFTFTTVSCGNLLRPGQPESIRVMGRFNVEEECSGQKLVKRLERTLKGGI